VLKFGKCKLKNTGLCKARHAFVGQDEVQNIPKSGIIKFDIRGMKDPLHYKVVITEHKDENTQEWMSNAHHIEMAKTKQKELQEYMKKEDNIIGASVVNVDELYAYFLNKSYVSGWFRAKVLEKSEQIDKFLPFNVHISLIDNGNVLKVKSNQLKVLGEGFKYHYPLITNLRITNLVPFDFDETFHSDTTNQVEMQLKNLLIENTFIQCNVELAFQNTIIAENFVVYKKLDRIKSYKRQCSLRELLENSQYCVSKSDILENLKDLASQADLLVYKKVNWIKKIEKNLQLKEIEAKPNWREIKIGEIYKVSVTDFENPYRMIVMTNHKSPHFDFNDAVKNCQMMPLGKKSIDSFCIFVKNDVAYRSIITNIDPYEILLLDVGTYINCTAEELFKMPPELSDIVINILDCFLIGVKPSKDENVKSWSAEQLKNIKKLLDGKNFHMIPHSKSSEDFYEISLFDLKNSKNIVHTIVAKNYAERDKNVSIKDVLQNNVCDENDIENEQDLMEVWKDNAAFIEDYLKKQKNVVPNDNRTNCNKISLDCPTKNEHYSGMSFIYPHPKIMWSQNDVSLKLYIQAFDAIEYALKITDSVVNVLIENGNGKFSCCKLSLQYSIVPRFLTHEIIGNMIVVKLIKRKNIEWTQLTDDLKENNYLIKRQFKDEQNIEAFRIAGESEDECEDLNDNVLQSQYFDEETNNECFI
jgi:hypothetical protein